METPDNLSVYTPDTQSVLEKCKKRILEQSKNKLVISDLKGQKLKFNGVNSSNSLYFINCEDCTIRIHNNLVNISLEGCKNFHIIFNKIVAKMEILNSRDIKVSSREIPQTFQLDFCDSVDIKVSERAHGVKDSDLIFCTFFSTGIRINGKTIQTRLENYLTYHSVDLNLL